MSWQNIMKVSYPREKPTRNVEDLSMEDYLRVNRNISRDFDSLWGAITRYWNSIGKVKGSMDGKQILDLIKGNSRNPNIIGAFNWADPALRFGTNIGESYHDEIGDPTQGNLFGGRGENYTRVADNALFRPNMSYQGWMNAAPILYVEYRGINIAIYLQHVVSLFSMLDRLTIQKIDMFDDVDLGMQYAETPLNAESLQWMTYDQVKKITKFDVSNTIDITVGMKRDSMRKLRENKEDLKYLKIDNLIIAATKDYKIPETPRKSRILEYVLGTIHMDSTARANNNLTKEFIIYLDDEQQNSGLVEIMDENYVAQKLNEYRREMQHGTRPVGGDFHLNRLGEYNLKNMVRFLSGRRKDYFRDSEESEPNSINTLEPINADNLRTIQDIIDSERAKKFRRFRNIFTDDLSDAVDNFWLSVNKYNEAEKARGGSDYLTLTPEHYKNYFHGYDVKGYLEHLPPDFAAYLERGSTAEIDSSKLKLFSAEYKLVMRVDVEEDYLKGIPHTISNLNASYHFNVIAENKNWTPKTSTRQQGRQSFAKEASLYNEIYGPMGSIMRQQTPDADTFRRQLQLLIPEKWNLDSSYAKNYFRGYDSPPEARGHTMLMSAIEQANFKYADGHSFLSTEYIPRIERHVLRIDFRWLHYLGLLGESRINHSYALQMILQELHGETPYVYTIRKSVFYADVFAPQSMGNRRLRERDQDGYRRVLADRDNTDWKSCIYPSKQILIGVAEGHIDQQEAVNMVCIHMKGIPKGDLIATQFLMLGNYCRAVNDVIKEHRIELSKIKQFSEEDVEELLGGVYRQFGDNFYNQIERMGGPKRIKSMLVNYPHLSNIGQGDVNSMMNMVGRIAEVERFYDLAAMPQHAPRMPNERFILGYAPNVVPRWMGGRMQGH
tara:strand:+ start:1637 stop:4312 length:2676 start_codon:yes stop_codon:yes gene_type:complete